MKFRSIASVVCATIFALSASASFAQEQQITDGYWTQEDHFCQEENVAGKGLKYVCYTVWVDPWGGYRIERKISDLLVT